MAVYNLANPNIQPIQFAVGQEGFVREPSDSNASVARLLDAEAE